MRIEDPRGCLSQKMTFLPVVWFPFLACVWIVDLVVQENTPLLPVLPMGGVPLFVAVPRDNQ